METKGAINLSTCKVIHYYQCITTGCYYIVSWCNQLRKLVAPAWPARKMSQDMSYSTFRYHHCKDMFLPLALVFCLCLTLFLLPLDVGVWRNCFSSSGGSAAKQQSTAAWTVQDSSQALPHWIPGGNLEGNDALKSMGLYSRMIKYTFFFVITYIIPFYLFLKIFSSFYQY